MYNIIHPKKNGLITWINYVCVHIIHMVMIYIVTYSRAEGRDSVSDLVHMRLSFVLLSACVCVCVCTHVFLCVCVCMWVYACFEHYMCVQVYVCERNWVGQEGEKM